MLVSEFALLVPQALHGIERLLAWLATYTVHSTVLILLAAALTARRAPWRIGPRVRDVVWKCALFGAIVTASGQVAFGGAPLAGTWPLRQRASATHGDMAIVVTSTHDHDAELRLTRGMPDATHLPSGSLRVGAKTVAIAAATSTATLVIVVAGMLWLTACFVTAVRADRAHARLDRSLRDRVPADDSTSGATLRYLATRAGLRRPIQLSTSERLDSPAALDGSEICVPPRFLVEVNLLEQESILAHELAHVVRRDVLWLRLANVVTALFFFQPLNRLARGRWQENAEFAADDWAVQLTGAPLRLARGLAIVASWLTAKPRLPVPAMAGNGGSVLVRRVAHLTAPRVAVSPGVWHPLRVGATVAAVLTAMVMLAPRIDVADRPRAAEARGLVVQRIVRRASAGETRDVRVIDVSPVVDQEGRTAPPRRPFPLSVPNDSALPHERAFVWRISRDDHGQSMQHRRVVILRQGPSGSYQINAPA